MNYIIAIEHCNTHEFWILMKADSNLNDGFLISLVRLSSAVDYPELIVLNDKETRLQPYLTDVSIKTNEIVYLCNFFKTRKL